MRLSVVIPCFNEVLTIPRLAVALDAAVANLREQGHDTEILVVDDGSSDGSVDALSQWRAIGTLQNFPEFHKAFQCKPGDPMVRAADKQCKLW